jgi:hypothetical protein
MKAENDQSWQKSNRPLKPPLFQDSPGSKKPHTRRRLDVLIPPMKRSQAFALVAACAILSQTQISAPAQGKFIFRGTCVQTNATGGFRTVTITHETLLNEAAQAAGVDPGTLTLVYHLHGTDFGDTVDIVNSSTGVVVDTLFGFYFGESFGRQAITNAAGNIVKRLDYIYTKQNDHSLGNALVTKTYSSNRPTRISGTMNWVVTPTGTKGTKICNGTFSVGPVPFFFINQP